MTQRALQKRDNYTPTFRDYRAHSALQTGSITLQLIGFAIVATIWLVATNC